MTPRFLFNKGLAKRVSAVLALLLWLPAVVTSGCYDHSWTQAAMAKRKAAEAAKGAEVSTGGVERPIRYVGKVKIYATPDYQAMRTDWEQRVRSEIDAAGSLLGPAFGLRLEVVSTHDWEPECDPANLQACLRELIADEPGDEVDWVVGLVAAQPLFTNSFDDLAVAALPGRHIVMRDLSNIAERDAIDNAFASMPKAQRDDIYRERLKHKRLVVFLHEWAHTMGAPHTRGDEHIMYRAYDDEMAGYSDENIRLIEASLADRFPLDPALSNLRRFVNEHQPEQWIPSSYETLLASLKSLPARSPAATPSAEASSQTHAFLISGEPDQLFAEVADQDRARYEDAAAKLLDQDSYAAWELLEPLVPRYPDNYAIQHFACSLSMTLGIAGQTGAACERTIRLASPQSHAGK
jgi:hypothetical protein